MVCYMYICVYVSVCVETLYERSGLCGCEWRKFSYQPSPRKVKKDHLCVRADAMEYKCQMCDAVLCVQQLIFVEGQAHAQLLIHEISSNKMLYSPYSQCLTAFSFPSTEYIDDPTQNVSINGHVERRKKKEN